MSDIPKYLPLSQRPRRDESGVTGNWARASGEVLTHLADLVDGLSDEQWTAVADDANSTFWHVTSSRIQRLRRHRAATKPRDDVATGLRVAATTALDPSAKRSLRTLSAAVFGTVVIGDRLGTTVALDPIASGAVALARSLSAPLPIRAVLTDTSLAATDADWRVGSGPVRYGTAAAILLFLNGRGPLPDDPAPATAGSSA
jgi:hypothetical protein